MVFKIFVWIFALLLLTTSVNAFGDVANYEQKDKYGVYTFETGFGFLPEWLGGGEKGFIQLTENTNQCLTNCYAKGIGNFYEKKNFIDGISFKDTFGQEVNNLGLLKIEIKKDNIWEEYQGEEVEGFFEWKISVKKSPTQKIDWILTVWGEELDKWAWWNSDWFRKRVVTINNTVATVRSNETIVLDNLTLFDSNNGFVDLRVLNNESAELQSALFDAEFKINRTSTVIGGVDISNTAWRGRKIIPNRTATLRDITFLPISTGSTAVNVSIYNGSAEPDIILGSRLVPITLNIDNTAVFGDLIIENGTTYWVVLFSSGTVDIRDVDGTTSESVISGNQGSTWTVTNDNAPSIFIGYGNYTKLRFKTNLTASEVQEVEVYYDNPSASLDQTTLPFDTNTQRATIDLTIGEEIVLGAKIDLLLPLNNSAINTEDINFVCNASYNSSINNISLLIDNVTLFTEDTPANSIVLNTTQTIADGNHNYTCKAITLDGKTSEANQFIFLVDTTSPNITVFSPNGTFNLLEQSQNLTLNFTIEDNSALDNCSYNYNGILTYVGCSGTSFNNKATIIYEAGINNILITANDTASLKTTLNHTWDPFITDFSRTFNLNTTEGNLETFSQNVTIKDGVAISDVFFVYNHTSHIGEKFLISANKYLIRIVDFTIPSVTSEVDKTFYWSIDLDNSLNINLSSSNQTVKNLAIDNCSVFTNKIMNFTIYDEEDQEKITVGAEIEVAVNIYNSMGDNLILNFSELTGANPTSVCLNTALLNTSEYSLSSITRYTATGYSNEYYNIQNLTLTESTALQDIKLYPLNETDSTEFRLTFIGSEFLPVENALVYLDRQYISDNNFKTVELPKTDSNGETVLHMVKNEIIYNIRIIKNNIVLGTFNNLVAFCEDFTIGDCTISLNAFTSGEEIFDYNEDLGILFTQPVFNDTQNKVLFNFLSSDGSIKNVSMEVIRSDIFGNRSICTTELISSGGTLQCAIDPNLDDTTLGTIVKVNGIDTVFKVLSLDTDNYGAIGYLVYFIMAIAFALLFTESKTLVLISLVLSFATAIGLGILNSNLIGLGASGVWLIIMVILGIWRLNRERPQ